MSNALIRRLRRFTGLGETDLAWLEKACATSELFRAGDDILRSYQSGSHLLVVLEGWAARCKVLADGRQQYPALTLPGEICNIDTLLMDRLDFGIVALTDCAVAAVPLSRLRDMLDESPALRDTMWWLTVWENSVASEWAVSLGRRSAAERLAHLFCELQLRLASCDSVTASSYALPLTQQAIADALGLSAVHVNRSLMALVRRGLISLRSRHLNILDWEGLKAVADFRPAYLHLEGMQRRPKAQRLAGSRVGNPARSGQEPMSHT